MLKIYRDIIQGSDEWRALRCGLLTASEMKLIITPTLKAASNDKERSHLFELMGQRITRFVEPGYISDDMLRGHEDEIDARALYVERYAPVQEVGFVTNNRWGFTLGCSPDGLVGDDGMIECKSRRQKYQIETIVNFMIDDEAPDDYALQVQSELLITERKWCDFVSFSAGLPMVTIRVYPDPVVHAAIISAATAFENRLAQKMAVYLDAMKSDARLIPTERRVYEDIIA